MQASRNPSEAFYQLECLGYFEDPSKKTCKTVYLAPCLWHDIRIESPDPSELTMPSLPACCRVSSRGLPRAVIALSLLAGSSSVLGQANPVMLEWFECSWANMEYRMPDFFIAGYASVWVPPVSQASDPTSPGYDVFDRFDLGSPADRTVYGTEQGFDAVVEQFHRASTQVFVDAIMNHNSGRNGSTSFYNDGGYPGFWLGPGPTPLNSGSNWGDFHNGATQSHDPSGGAGAYNLWLGDLVSLIDIAQESNNQYIRQPASASPPPGGVNIPAGAVRNQPNPANVRYYPDKQLSSTAVNNPGQSRPACCGFADASSGSLNLTFYPFNADASQGDPSMENTTGYLMRWVEWMLDVKKVDGFRWDASKHIPPWFWDQYIDSIVYQRRTAPDGSKVTPYSFGENVMANDQIWNFYIRKGTLRTGYSFGNRDALDLSGSGTIRNMVNARGSETWNNVLGSHLDNADDADNNGSIGVNHIYSQDNGSAGTGSTQPALPAADKAAWPQFAYLLLRTGVPEVYHNARQFNTRTGGFWPREGSPEALGLGRSLTGTDPTLTRLVQLHNRYARGPWDVKILEGDVICFERHNAGLTNIVCCANDSYSNGYDQRTFVTRYPQGTRLVELSGNATDPVVDPNNDIFDTVTVGAGGSVTIRVPRNRNANGVEHNKGFVVYAQVTPPGTFSISSGLTLVAPPDSSGVAAAARRLSPVDVVQGNSFTIQLQTQNDPTEGALDDSAIYRFNQGFFNANFGTNGTASGEPTGEFAGYENFVTNRSPRIGGGTGLYQQAVSTSTLPEGMNYLSVVAFRQRAGGTSPIYSEWRDAIYVDRTDPVLAVDPFAVACADGSATMSVRNADRTAARVYVFIDLPAGDPLPTLTGANQALQYDRTQFLFSFTGLTNGTHTYTLVAQEAVGATTVRTSRYSPVSFNVNRLTGDFNGDNQVNTSDLTIILGFFGTSVTPGSVPDLNNDGFINTVDLTLFLGGFGGSCN